MLKQFALLLFCLASTHLYSQIWPKEGSILNYRLIGFSFPGTVKAKEYKIEIAKGFYISEDSFNSKLSTTIHATQNRVIGEVPQFGQQYSWRVLPEGNDKKGEIHHFSTVSIPEADTTNMRLRILTPSDEYKGAYVLLDNNKVMYDMKGNPVWFLPDKIAAGAYPTDMKVSPWGTITFLLINEYEINYDGDILWKAPNTGEVAGDSIEHYHHEFTKLGNGHYMTLGDEPLYWKKGLPAKQLKLLQDSANKDVPKSKFGTLIEYDSKGKVVWSWKSSKYFFDTKISDNNPAVAPTNDAIDVHANAFYFDERKGFIYVSYKNTNQVLKVKYPEGIVVNCYGEVYKDGVAKNQHPVFCGQHSTRHSDKGYMYLYNNNACENATPKIMLFEELKGSGNKLKEIWEYTCTVDSTEFRSSPKGGNITELNGDNFFVSMGGPYSKIFIVSKSKTILWSALPERWNTNEKKWDVVTQYRASIIKDRKELERLIWNKASK